MSAERLWAGLVVFFAGAALLAGCSRDAERAALVEGEYLTGQAAFLKGDFSEAHRRFAEVRKLSPNDRRLPVAEAEVYLAEGKVTEAQALFEQAVAREPQRGASWSRLGLVYALRGRHAEAQEAFVKALARNAADALALEGLGDAQMRQGDFDGGLGHWERAARAASQPEQATELYLRAFEVLSKARREGEARALLERAVASGVRTGGLLIELGELHARAGRLPEALAAYREAAEKESEDPSVWEVVGELCLRQGALDEAEHAFRQTLAQKDRALAHLGLARVCLARKVRECAEAELELALKSASGEELRESLDLAEVLALLGRASDARKLLGDLPVDQGLERDPALHLRLARIALAAGDTARARQACLVARDAGVARCP